MLTYLESFLGSPRKAFWTVLLLACLPVLRWFALVLLLLMTLRKGAKASWPLLLAVCLPIVVVHHWYPQPALWQLQLVGQITAWLMALLLRTTASWSLLLEVIAIIGFVLVLAIHAAYPNVTGFWQHYLANAMTELRAAGGSAFAKIDQTQMQWISEHFAKIATGGLMVEIILSNLVALGVARYLQACLFNPGGLKQELYSLHFTVVPTLVALAITGVALATQQVFLLDGISLLLLPFFCAGISLVHWASASLKGQIFYLVGFYILLLLLFLQLVGVLVLAGIADAFFNFRNRSAAALKR